MPEDSIIVMGAPNGVISLAELARAEALPHEAHTVALNEALDNKKETTN